MSDRPVVYWCLGEAGPDGAGLTIQNAAQLLSTEEMIRFEQLRFPKRRNEWLLGRVTAKHLLTRCVPELAGVDYQSLTIANHAHGAPFASLGGRQLPLRLSISHREGLAAAAVTLIPGAGLGIDLEWVEERAESFYTDYFTPIESRLLQEMQSSQKAWAGTLIWSAKEAMLKALGQGLRLDTRSVEVLRIANDGIGGWCELEVHADAGSPWHGFWRQIGGHIGTIALLGAVDRPVLEQIGGLKLT